MQDCGQLSPLQIRETENDSRHLQIGHQEGNHANFGSHWRNSLQRPKQDESRRGHLLMGV